jgi:hypothetical protein
MYGWIMDGRQPPRRGRIRSGVVVACVRGLTACRSSVVVCGGHSDSQCSCGSETTTVFFAGAAIAPRTDARRRPPSLQPCMDKQGTVLPSSAGTRKIDTGQIGEYSDRTVHNLAMIQSGRMRVIIHHHHDWRTHPQPPDRGPSVLCYHTVPAPRRSCNTMYFSRSNTVVHINFWCHPRAP